MSQGYQYTCENCGRTFTSDWSQEEALQEMRENLPEARELILDGDDLVNVCDDCYQEFLAWYRQNKQAGTLPTWPGQKKGD